MAPRGPKRGSRAAVIAGVAAALAVAAPAWARSGSGRIGDIGQAVFSLAVFALLATILGKWAWKPIIAQLRRREETIGQRLRDTERLEKEARDLEAAYRARMARADDEAKEHLARKHAEAAQERENILAAAREQGKDVLQAAESEIERLKREAVRDLQETTAQLAVDIAGEILQEKLDAQDHQRLMAQSLERVRQRVEKQPS